MRDVRVAAKGYELEKKAGPWLGRRAAV